MTIHLILKHVQGEDMDSWQHWVDDTPVTYHTTNEAAHKEISSLLAGKPNSEEFRTGPNGKETVVTTLYFTREIKLKS